MLATIVIATRRRRWILIHRLHVYPGSILTDAGRRLAGFQRVHDLGGLPARVAGRHNLGVMDWTTPRLADRFFLDHQGHGVGAAQLSGRCFRDYA